jgi:uncharacterized membrane protein YebE (DUF533 family)
MNPGFIVDGVLRSVFGGGRKRSRRAYRYLTHRHGSFWTSPSTIMTAVGLAWGVYDTLNKQAGQETEAAPGAPTPPSTPAATLPPLPTAAASPGPGVSEDVLRLIRLAISAASADGVMNDRERAAIVQQAQAAGVAELVEDELQQRRPLAGIVQGVSNPIECATLYVLAFTVLRADEQVTGAERIYLAQLAHLLNLDPETVQRLEKDTGERIDALGEEKGN